DHVATGNVRLLVLRHALSSWKCSRISITAGPRLPQPRPQAAGSDNAAGIAGGIGQGMEPVTALLGRSVSADLRALVRAAWDGDVQRARLLQEQGRARTLRRREGAEQLVMVGVGLLNDADAPGPAGDVEAFGGGAVE